MLVSGIARSQNVGIGTAIPNPSAKLDITSTTSGLLIPRMTSAQRAAITSPATGLLVYQVDGTAGYYYYNGSAWAQLGGSDGDWTISGSDVYRLAGTVCIGTNSVHPILHLRSFSAGNKPFMPPPVPLTRFPMLSAPYTPEQDPIMQPRYMDMRNLRGAANRVYRPGNGTSCPGSGL